MGACLRVVCFDLGGSRLFKVSTVGKVKVDVVVDVDAMGVGAGSTEGCNTPGLRASFAAIVNCGLICHRGICNTHYKPKTSLVIPYTCKRTECKGGLWEI